MQSSRRRNSDIHLNEDKILEGKNAGCFSKVMKELHGHLY